jgi:hypothetical protein
VWRSSGIRLTLATHSRGGEIKVAARALQITLQSVEVRGPDDFEPAFSAIKKERAGGLTWIGIIIRKKLNLKTPKSHRVYVIPLSEKPKLDQLYEKYGMGTKEAEEPDTDESHSYKPVG